MIGAVAAAAAILLAVSGLAKIRSPAPAAAMITRLLPRIRLPRTLAVRVGGVGETTIAIAFLSLGGRLSAGLVAACYLVFAVVALRLATGGRRTSCGCFGAVDSPVVPAHVALDVVCLAAAGTAAAIPVGAGAGLFRHGPLVAAIGCGQVALLAWLGYLSVTSLPVLASLSRVKEAR